MIRLLLAIFFSAALCTNAMASGSKSAPAQADAARTYKVREGDTLGAIAKKYGVSAVALATFNKLEDADNLHEGQVLKIPAAAAVSTAPSRAVALPGDVKAALDKMRIIPGKWRYIVVHHSASKQGTPMGMDAYHRYVRHMENGLAYHFVIGNGAGMGDGSIFIGNRWRGQIDGGHLASEALNAKAIGICLVGNFDDTRPTQKEMQSLYALVSYLRQRCRLPTSAVKLHRQINPKPTECPGAKFPAQTFFDNI